VGTLHPCARGTAESARGPEMSPLLALADGVVFAIGGVVFLAVCCGALVLGYTRFAELGEDDHLQGNIEER